jgi:hypothetical protein
MGKTGQPIGNKLHSIRVKKSLALWMGKCDVSKTSLLGGIQSIVDPWVTIWISVVSQGVEILRFVPVIQDFSGHPIPQMTMAYL